MMFVESGARSRSFWRELVPISGRGAYFSSRLAVPPMLALWFDCIVSAQAKPGMRVKCRRCKVGVWNVESLPGGFPVQRGEGGDVVDGPGGELRQNVVEVFAQIDLEAFAGLHNGEDGRDFGTGFLASDM